MSSAINRVAICFSSPDNSRGFFLQNSYSLNALKSSGVRVDLVKVSSLRQAALYLEKSLSSGRVVMQIWAGFGAQNLLDRALYFQNPPSARVKRSLEIVCSFIAKGGVLVTESNLHKNDLKFLASFCKPGVSVIGHSAVKCAPYLTPNAPSYLRFVSLDGKDQTHMYHQTDKGRIQYVATDEVTALWSLFDQKTEAFDLCSSLAANQKNTSKIEQLRLKHRALISSLLDNPERLLNRLDSLRSHPEVSSFFPVEEAMRPIWQDIISSLQKKGRNPSFPDQCLKIRAIGLLEKYHLLFCLINDNTLNAQCALAISGERVNPPEGENFSSWLTDRIVILKKSYLLARNVKMISSWSDILSGLEDFGSNHELRSLKDFFLLEKDILHRAVEFDNIVALKAFLNLGISINSLNSDGETPLHTAVRSSNAKMMRFLFDNEVNHRIQNKAGWTAFDLIEFYDDIELLEEFIGR